MKISKLIWCALCVTVFAAFSLVGCEGLDPYSINAPADLQARIDSIAAANAGTDSGDTTFLTIATAIVGAEDNSSGWNGAHSDYFTIPTNKLLHLEFVNYGTGANNWNNWNLAVNKVEANSEDYDPNNPGSGYFTIRSDAYGWGSTMASVDPGYVFDIDMVDIDYPDTDGDGSIWNDFKTTMQGAYVTIEVDHSATGNVYVTATAVGTNGTTLVETYQQPVSATDDIVAYLVTDGSHFEMKKAYLLPSKVTAVEDVKPTSIDVTGSPAFVELGNNNFWGAAIATVTYADGSTEQVDSADLSFTVIPVMTTIGEKTVIVSYSKTKQGASTQTVSTFYTLEVTGAVESIAASNINYYYYSSDDIKFKPEGIVVTATYSDGSTAVLEDNVLEFQYPGTIPSTAGSQIVNIKYVGVTKTFTTTSTVTLVKGVSQVGKSDLSSGWWTAFSDEYTVASGSSKTFTFYCYSDNLANYHSPVTILRKADKTEYAVVRMDNFGWSGVNNTNDNLATLGWTLTSDWDWDTFTSNISSSKVVIKVTNNGNGTADILYTVTYANGETHFQKYAGITVNSSDLNCALTTEKAYLVFVE